jgi:hypothetical protein
MREQRRIRTDAEMAPGRRQPRPPRRRRPALPVGSSQAIGKLIPSRPTSAIRRHVSVEFDLLVADVDAMEDIAHPAMRTYVDASSPGLRENDDARAAIGPDELHTLVSAMMASALTHGVESVFPSTGTELANLVVTDTALGHPVFPA